MKFSFFKSIRVRIIILVIIMISIPFGILQYTNTALIYDKLQSKTIYTTEALSHSIATNVSEFIDGAYDVTRLLADNQEVISGTSIGESTLQHAVEMMPYFKLFYMQDQTGMQTIRSSGELANRSDRWWFQQILTTPESFVSDAYISVNNNELVTSIFIPVYENSRLHGILGADLSLASIQEATKQYLNQDISYIVMDSKGSVLTGSDYNKGEYINYIEGTRRTVVLDTDGNYSLDENGQILTTTENITLSSTMKTIIANALDKKSSSFQFQDEDKNIIVCSYEPIDLPGNSEPWTVIVFQKQTDQISIVLLVIIFAILIILCIGITFRQINQYLLKPVIKIQQDMEAISAGSLDVRIDLPPDNEIGNLAANINSMVSSLKHQQQRLHEDEKMAALGNLVAGVAHEINTPIGIGVTTSTYIQSINQKCRRALSEGTMTKGELLDYMNTLDESLNLLQFNLERGSDIIQSFKKIAVDQTSDTIEEFQVKSYLNGIALSLVHEYKNSGHSLEIHCDDDLTMHSYPGAFAQILTNLIMNSLTHAFHHTEHGMMTIEAFRAEGSFTLLYKDNGCGVPPDKIGNLFSPFYTTNKEMGGSGLGLSIVYNLVTQKLNGTITATSEEGNGITFTIIVPD